jgi:hypothetical protein
VAAAAGGREDGGGGAQKPAPKVLVESNTSAFQGRRWRKVSVTRRAPRAAPATAAAAAAAAALGEPGDWGRDGGAAAAAMASTEELRTRSMWAWSPKEELYAVGGFQRGVGRLRVSTLKLLPGLFSGEEVSAPYLRVGCAQMLENFSISAAVGCECRFWPRVFPWRNIEINSIFFFLRVDSDSGY